MAVAQADIPHSPLPLRGPWPQAYLDDIHLWLANSGGQVPFANLLGNSGFILSQRIGTAATNVTGTAMTLDRWRVSSPGTCQITQELAPVAFPQFTNVLGFVCPNVGATPPLLIQRLSGVSQYRGDFSFTGFYHGSVIDNFPLDVTLTQNFGTGGAPSAAVRTLMGTIPANTSGALVPFAMSATLPSDAGKTLGTNGDDYLELEIKYIRAAAQAVLQTKFAGLDLRRGINPGVWSPYPLSVELELCGAYFRKSYDRLTLPGAVTSKGSVMTRAGAALASLAMPGLFGGRMIRTPLVTLYSPVTGTAARVSNLTGPADIVVNATDPNETTWGVITLAAAPAAADMIRMQWTADAEL